MARQTRTIQPTAKSGGADSAQALKNLERVADVARKSERIVQAAANIARAREYRGQLPAEGSLAKDELSLESEYPPQRRTASDGSRSGFSAASSRSGNGMKIAKTDSGWHRVAAMVDAGARWQRQILDLSRAVNDLARVERAGESGRAGRAIPDGRKDGTPALPSNTDPSGRVRESLEGRRVRFAEAGLPASVRFAPSIRGVIPPANVSRREFARPSSDGRAPDDGSGRAGITINSSPTVVINAPAGNSVQHDVIRALQAHREELFDQWKRESERRERAQF